MITVHMVFNAHLDPVWLWPWQAGLDEALNTARSACSLLDEYPDAVFTMGEAWRYGEIERVDPALFVRIRGHIEAGRWEIVGGWYVQPDCNFPNGFGIERQIELGKRYFTERFGAFPEVAYNVDSFGHTATLPGYMHAAGQRYYVMMRPQEHEMPLPARLFRWRGFEDGPEVVTFRIAGAYCTGAKLNPDHVRRALTELPPGIEHTMCFLGVGDHGGGPTAKLIEDVRANAKAFDGAQLIFSTPARFFRAVAGHIPALPLVTGELQMHAVGCYSVVRGIKTRVQRAEHLLRRAELVAASDDDRRRIDEAWRHVCFNQFHDTLGGTCIPSAYAQQYEQLGAATATADDILQHVLRHKLNRLPDDPLQRAVFLNASDQPFEGYVEFEPWTQWSRWQPEWRLLNGHDRPVPFQILRAEAMTGPRPRVLMRLSMDAGGMRVVKLDRQGGPPTLPETEQVHARDQYMMAFGGAQVYLGHEPTIMCEANGLAFPRLEMIEDRSDNWSHGVERYPDGPVISPQWDAAWLGERGPLMAALFQTGHISDSTLLAEWRVYQGEPFVELILRVHWRERHKLLRLVLPLTIGAAERRDGIPGGSLARPNSGVERPLRDWTLCPLTHGPAVGVVCPDVYAINGAPDRLRFTLLRSPIQTHHDPNREFTPRITYADGGEHTFRFRFFCGDLTPDGLDRQALMLHRPPLVAELTRGMPKRWD